ncbi:MAG: hypothetical protein K9M96_08775 [Deltaproteobacteria bacterium]|nr:hypothetical protein [Deltaproteobacteria bacterium]
MSIEKAKKMLPNIPDEVFDIWLSELIKRDGWPFESTTDSLVGTPWIKHLGGLPLEILANFIWNRKLFTFNTLPLKQFNRLVIKRMFSESIDKFGALTNGPFINSKERLLFHIDKITRTGRFWAPIILATAGGDLDILDGFHRIVALLILKKEDIEIDAWVAYHPQYDSTIE